VDTVDAVIGGLERIGKMASERWMRLLSEGCPSMGRKSNWAAGRAEVIALGVMVAGRGNWGGLQFLKTRNIY
jgi:hypothetical protein